MTAAEFIAQRESDPVFLARRKELERVREEVRARCARDEEELVAELRELGFRVSSVYDLVNNRPNPLFPGRFVGPYREAYPVLLKHLSIEHEPNIREGIIRALIVRDLPKDALGLLLAQLRAEQNRVHRVCLALACRRALGNKRAAAHPEIEAAIRGGMLTDPMEERRREG